MADIKDRFEILVTSGNMKEKENVFYFGNFLRKEGTYLERTTLIKKY